MVKRYSTIASNYPSFQDAKHITLNSYSWLKSRHVDDNAEGLWRIHDNLYDLSQFINDHPGGRDWLLLTKGTDITEAFEVHHINIEKAESFLGHFFVRQAIKPRNFKFTFDKNGFYRTLKKRVKNELITVSRTPEFLSKLFIDVLFCATFFTAVLSVRLQSIIILLLASLLMTWTVIIAHNFFHKKDNFRMFYFNLSLLSYKEWRISHAMSHHMYPNSLYDLEITMFEPLLCWLPKSKSFFQRYISWIYGPLLYSGVYVNQIIKRSILSYTTATNLFTKGDFIPLALPLQMYMFGNSNLTYILQMWFIMLLFGSFLFGVIGLHAGHHNTDVIHDGDTLRENLDWGLYTLDTIIDNSDFCKNQFMALTHFGHHALHHLFPTIDHGILPQLYPILFKTMHEFETDLLAFPWFYHVCGQMKQLARVEKNKDNPIKKYTKIFSFRKNE